MTARSRVRLLLVAVAAAACDTGITPPADVPVLALSAREVAMFAPKGSTTPDTAFVIVSNNGRGTLAGLTLTPPAYQDAATGWLTATLQDTTIVLAASAEHLTIQATPYTATLGVVLPAADSSPRTITVTFEVGQTQQIALSDTGLTFGAIAGGALPPPAQTITVTNGGTGVLSELRDPTVSYRPLEPQGWLTAALGSPIAPARINIVPNAIPSGPGAYHAMVIVSSRIADPESDTVQVTFVVAEPPTLALATNTLVLDAVEGDGPIVRQVLVREAKLRPLASLVVSPQPPSRTWLTRALDATETPATLTLTADPAGLAGDSVYRDTVLVSAEGGTSAQAVVTLVVRKGPAPRASVDSVRFTTYRSGPIPTLQVVGIENEGRGILTGLSASVMGDSSWLAASLAGSAPAALSLQVDTTGVPPGVAVAADVIISGNTAHRDTVHVRLSVLGGPRLALSSGVLTFRADSGQTNPPLPQVLAIANGGEGVLSGFSTTVLYPDPGDTLDWLTAGLSGPTAPITLTVQPAAPDTVIQPGVHTALVVMRSAAASNSPDTVAITYVVRSGTDPRTVLAAGADAVGLVRVTSDAGEPAAEIGIENLGTTALTNLVVVTKPPWLDWTFTKPAGNARRTPTLLRLTAISGLVPPNTTQTGTVTVDSDESAPITFPVALTVAAPTMAATVARVRFQSYQRQSVLPDTQRFTIANGGAGALGGVSVDAGSVPSWLSVQSTPTPAAVRLQPTTTTLAPTTYRDTLRISSSAAANTPLRLPVAFEVDSGPTVAVSPGRVALSGIARGNVVDTQLVAVTNSGRGTLGNVRIGPTRGWLVATLDASVAPATLTLVASAAGLDSGTVYDTVRVLSSDAGNVAQVVVAFDVVPPPRIRRSPAVLAFHVLAGDPVPADTQAFTVFDPAGRPTGGLTVSPTGDSAWLHVEAPSGTAPATIRVWPIAPVPDASDTAYVATIRIVDSLTPDTLTATVKYYVDLGRSPAIWLSRDSLTFDRPNPPAQTVKITNAGSGTLRELFVRDTTGVDWLFVLLDSRIAPATLTVAVDPAKAADAPANSVAVLEITGEGAQPRYITVTLR